MKRERQSASALMIAALLWVFLVAPVVAALSVDHSDFPLVLSLITSLLLGWGIDKFQARSRGRDVDPPE